MNNEISKNDQQEEKKVFIKSESISQEYNSKSINSSLSVFIKDWRKDYKAKMGQSISLQDISSELGMSYEMFRKIVNKQKPTEKRDFIIALCAILFRGRTDIKSAFDTYGLPFPDNDSRTEFIISYIEKTVRDNTNSVVHKKLELSDLNQKLMDLNYQGLDIHNSKKIETHSLPTDNSNHKDIISNIIIGKEEIMYIYDERDALGYKYDPTFVLQYFIKSNSPTSTPNIRIKLPIYNKEEEKSYSLYAFADGKTKVENEFGSEITNIQQFQPLFQFMFKKIENTKNYLLNTLNDTLYYQKRYAARMSADKDSLCFIAEKFNYESPERRRYCLLKYIDGEYHLCIYNKSAFLYNYLEENDYNFLYGCFSTPKLINEFSFDSLQQKIANSNIDEKIYFVSCLKIFKELKDSIEDMIISLKNSKVFIRDIDDFIFDDDPQNNPIHFFKLDELLHKQSHTYPIKNTRWKVKISYEDALIGFRLGIIDKDQLFRVKHKLKDLNLLLP